MENNAGRFSFANLSIQKRLSLFISLLLLCVILVFSYTSYLAVKNAALVSAKERLSSLTEQISSMFQQFGNIVLNKATETAKREPVKRFLISN